MSEFGWVCPDCRAVLEQTGGGDLICPAQGTIFRRRDGVFVLMNEERLRCYEPFVADYAEVRRREGRGSCSSEFYRALPDRDLSGRHPLEWRIRAASFRTLMREVVPELRMATGRDELHVADLGAGNCWMSHRLEVAGHHVVAVDIFNDPDDGLGAHRHYSSRFQPVQAEFDRLPVATESFDLVIFNGALHYSTDLATTLREAFRVLRPGGALAILDSPIYRNPEAGREMKAELHRSFEQRYGCSSDRLDTLGFLTEDNFDDMAEEFDMRWQRVRPFYGLRWALRPLLAKLRGRREPASFYVIWGVRREDPGA